MSYPTLLIKSLLIFLCCCCCSFSAVPTKPLPPQKKSLSKIKRQKRQELRQKRQLHRLHKRQKTSKLQKPLKKNAVFNVTGFLLIIGSLVLFFVGIIAIFGIFGIFGAFVTTLVFTLLGLVIAGGVAGFICCIIGLVGSEKAEKPLRGFGVIGVIIVGIPLLVGLVVLFAALFRFVGLLA